MDTLINGYLALQSANNYKSKFPVPKFETLNITKKAIGISFEEIGPALNATYVVIESDGTIKETGTIKKFVLTSIECQLAKIDIITMLKLFHNCDVKYETL